MRKIVSPVLTACGLWLASALSSAAKFDMSVGVLIAIRPGGSVMASERVRTRWLWAAPALLSLALAGCASVGGQIDDATARAELTAFQDTWVAAEIAGDADTLRSLMDERFLSTDSKGETSSREEYIDWITGFEVNPFTAELNRIELHGDTAILISTIGEHTKLTWVAQRRDGRWVGLEQTFMRLAKPD
jgi:hypothetical protein